MGTKTYNRNYNMPDADLCMFVSDLCSDMTRDLSDLAVFGVTTINITNMQTLGNAFEIFPSDEMLLGDVMSATATKNEQSDLVKESIRNMALRVAMKWGTNSGQYARLGVLDMNNLSDEALLFAARRIHTVMTEYLSDLAADGLTTLMLSDFEALNEALEVAKNDRHDKINLRDMKTVERIAKGNELFTYVSKYCEIGKRVYAATDPAKYNDYLIYPNVGGGALVAVTGLAYNMLSQIFTWGTQANATSYSLEASSDNSNFVEIYSGAATTFTYNAGGAVRYYRCRARNSSGFGDYSNVINVTYSETLDVPDNMVVIFSQSPNQIHLSWDAVVGAESYVIYGCEVNIGDLPSGFALRGSSVTNSYTESVILEKRYYYVVYPIAGAEVGLPSQVAFKDTI